MYFWNILISIDQFINTLLGGYPDETMSSRMGKHLAKRDCIICTFICGLLNFIQKDHCKRSIEIDEGSLVAMSEINLIQPKVENTFAALSSAQTIPDGIHAVGADTMWKRGYTGKGTVIAVIDTGIDMLHEDLQGCVIAGYNFTTENDGDVNNYQDHNGHGTHVCGIIAANNNSIGVVGVAPNAKILVLKVLDANGSGTAAAIVAALKYAGSWVGPNGELVNIVSMSLGAPMDFPGLHDAVKTLVFQRNILVICAAGNSGDGNVNTDELSYPGCYDEVVSVGAINDVFEPASFSNSNIQIDVVAPGVWIQSTYLGGYATLSGTSMSTPHVAGVAALIIEEIRSVTGRGLSEAELYGHICKRTYTLNYDVRLVGHGGVCASLDTDDLSIPDPSKIDIDFAISFLGQKGILNPSAFWSAKVAQFQAGTLVNADFKYVELLIKKVCGFIM